MYIHGHHQHLSMTIPKKSCMVTGRCSSRSLIFPILTALPLVIIILLLASASASASGATLRAKPVVAATDLPLHINSRRILDQDSDAKQVIFHPSTGLCVLRKSLADPLTLGSCSNSEGWNYSPQMILSIKGTYFCLQAKEEGKPAKLGITCSGANSRWKMISNSKIYFSSKASDGSVVCLDVDTNNIIVTNTCNCLSTDPMCDPASQWFKFIDNTSQGGQPRH